MGLDSSTLLAITAQELVNTKLAEMGPAMDDLICTQIERDALEGVLPYYAAKDQTGKSRGSIAIGADARQVDFDLSSVNYKMVRYANACTLDESEIQDLDQYRGALDPKITLPMLYNRIDRETDLYNLMTDSSFNGQQAVSAGTWDLATSTPYVDMQNVQLNDVPVIDMVVISFKTAQELQRHPATKEMAGAAYSGSGVTTTSLVRQAIANVYEISPENVHIWKTVANSAAFGQAFTLTRIMDEFFWAGQKAGLLKVSQPGQQNSATVEIIHKKVENAIHDTCDFLRVETFAGGEITGL